MDYIVSSSVPVLRFSVLTAYCDHLNSIKKKNTNAQFQKPIKVESLGMGIDSVIFKTLQMILIAPQNENH